MTRLRLGLIAALAVLVVVLGIGVASAAPARDSDRDAAVALALQEAMRRGEPAARVSLVQLRDAATLRSRGVSVPSAVTGPLWTINLTGRFDASKTTPDGKLVRGVFTAMTVYVREGKVVGTDSQP